jgi:prepilin-type N-terminal cleavage/methylation domain-containing protein/prepilin-type processing-associated H-X9-DG protein
MKRKPNSIQQTAGFTLVELLVVILIVATLAAVAFTMATKMKKRGDAAKSVLNMKQISSAMGLYMADSSGNLPTPRMEIKNPNGGTTHVHWHQSLLAQIYPDVEPSLFNDRKWWDLNKPFLRNPLMTDSTKPLAFQPWFPGYSYNMGINYNLTGSSDWNANGGGTQTKGINISKINEPARTPLVGTRGDWHYSGDDLVQAEVKNFLVDGKLPILFVDGHVETMTQREYTARKLKDMPKK